MDLADPYGQRPLGWFSLEKWVAIGLWRAKFEGWLLLFVVISGPASAWLPWLVARARHLAQSPGAAQQTPFFAQVFPLRHAFTSLHRLKPQAGWQLPGRSGHLQDRSRTRRGSNHIPTAHSLRRALILFLHPAHRGDSGPVLLEDTGLAGGC